ncbi:60S ribosomal protein L31 [Candidatus Woesearchaeota archaeon]|nr:60S ribosomal protein L31 [Candidatus Woesearchaeota archaeon]
MADKSEKLERTYTIPLRREFLKVPKYKRAEKASRAVREFLVKHMKCPTVSIGKYLNQALWVHGMRNPPSRVKVTVVKQDQKVLAELFGKQIKLEEKQVQKKAGIAERLKQKLGKKEEADVLSELKGKEPATEELKEELAEVKAEKAEEAKKIEHEEIKELKKEQETHHKHAPKQPAADHSQDIHPPAPKKR